MREEKIIFLILPETQRYKLISFFFKSCLFWHCPLNLFFFIFMFYAEVIFPALFHIPLSMIERCYPQKCSDIDTNSLSINLECSGISFVQLLSIVFSPKLFLLLKSKSIRWIDYMRIFFKDCTGCSANY